MGAVLKSEGWLGVRRVPHVVLMLSFWNVCAAQTPNASDPHLKFVTELGRARSSLESAASALPLLEVDDLMYRRWSAQSPSVQTTYRRTLSRILEANYSAESLIYLSTDTRPAVRTLAIILLFDKDDPELLRYISDHLNDA